MGYDWQDTNTSYTSQGYSYYKVFEAGNHQYWIYSINNGGGSGDFTSLDLVKRKDKNTLEIKNVTGGDRCNGGIQDVKLQGRQLSFSVNLTAYDLLPVANENPHHLKAYDDLSACAVCCVAKGVYEVNTQLQPKLNYVDLSGQPRPEEMPAQGTYHVCFNKLFADYVAKGQTKLDEAALKKFVKEFNATCVR